MQFMSNDQTVRSNTVQDLKGFNSRSLATQRKKGKLLVSLMQTVQRKGIFNKKIVVYGKKWFEESESKLKMQYNWMTREEQIEIKQEWKHKWKKI